MAFSDHAKVRKTRLVTFPPVVESNVCPPLPWFTEMLQERQEEQFMDLQFIKPKLSHSHEKELLNKCQYDNREQAVYLFLRRAKEKTDAGNNTH